MMMKIMTPTVMSPIFSKIRNVIIDNVITIMMMKIMTPTVMSPISWTEVPVFFLNDI